MKRIADIIRDHGIIDQTIICAPQMRGIEKYEPITTLSRSIDRLRAEPYSILAEIVRSVSRN